MIVKVSVATSRIIEECNTQTSLDLQAMRSRGVETADAVYEDWVLTEDNSVEVFYALQDLCTDMAFALRTLIRTYSAGRDVITIDIEDSIVEPNSGVVLEGMLRKYLKHGVLAWWYQYRDADLAKLNAESATLALNNLFTQCAPRTGTLVGRYF